MQEATFPFLRLPKDLRFMVYDLLEPSNKYVRLSNHPDFDPNSAILVIRSFDLAILATCKTVNEEASGILHMAAKRILSPCALQILRSTNIEATEDTVVLFLSAVREHRKKLRNKHGVNDNGDEWNLFPAVAAIMLSPGTARRNAILPICNLRHLEPNTHTLYKSYRLPFVGRPVSRGPCDSCNT
jgi:hypothetical protein